MQESHEQITAGQAQKKGTSLPQRLPEPVEQIQVAQPSGRDQPSRTPVGIWEDAEIPYQTTADTSEDTRETPR